MDEFNEGIYDKNILEVYIDLKLDHFILVIFSPILACQESIWGDLL